MTAATSAAAASADVPAAAAAVTASFSGASHAHAANGSESDRRTNRPAPLDPLSDRATLALIRRTLCPQQLKDKGRDAQPPVEELLPPLTSRSDVDLQLYAFVAIITREYVQSWYGKITTDETFVGEIVHIIAHCTRALEQRLRKLDLESLVLDELPDLLDRHVSAYRTAFHQASRGPVQVDPRQVYHSLCPLPGLSPVPQMDDPATVALQEENETANRQLLAQAVLAVLLPSEDLENPCLTALVSQILSELIIGNVVASKASQPWLLYEAICATVKSVEEHKARAAAEAADKLFDKDQTSSDDDVAAKSQDLPVQRFFVLLIHLGILFFNTIRFSVSVLADSIRLPPRIIAISAKVTSEVSSEVPPDVPHDQDAGALPTHQGSLPDKVPVLSFKIWPLFANLVGLEERRPWLSGFMSLLQTAALHGPWRVAGLDSPLDRLLSHHIQSLFDPSLLPSILRSLRGALFPNNSPGTSTLVPPSSEEELSALRRRAASAVWGLLPRSLSRAYFGAWRRGASDDKAVDELERLLMVVGDEYCNKHLMYGALELVLVRLMPELTDEGVAELWRDKLG